MAITLWRAAGAFTVAAVMALSTTADAQQQRKQKGKPRQVPDTGVEESVPTQTDAEAEARLEEMTSRSSEGLVEVAHPTGAVSLDLQGRFMSVMVFAPGADGRQRATCDTGVAALKLAASTRTTNPGIAQPAKGDATTAPRTTPALEIK
jgi:phage-related tail protein